MSKVYHLSIYRYNPDKDEQPFMQEIEVAEADILGIMLLDALKAAK